MHVDFFAPNLREKTTADIPVVLVGESPAVAAKQGVVLQVASSVRVEALPTDLPGQISADVGVLDSTEAAITAADLVLPHGVTLLVDPAEVIAKVSGRRVREFDEEELGAEGAEGAQAAAGDGASAEGEASSEG